MCGFGKDLIIQIDLCLILKEFFEQGFHPAQPCPNFSPANFLRAERVSPPSLTPFFQCGVRNWPHWWGQYCQEKSRPCLGRDSPNAKYCPVSRTVFAFSQVFFYGLCGKPSRLRKQANKFICFHIPLLPKK